MLIFAHSFLWFMHPAKEKTQKRGQRYTEEVTRGLGDAIEAHLHILILLILLYFLCSSC